MHHEIGVRVRDRAMLASRFVANQLFELSPYDPVSLFGAGAVLLGVTIAAGFVPARRATKIDSTQALKA